MKNPIALHCIALLRTEINRIEIDMFIVKCCVCFSSSSTTTVCFLFEKNNGIEKKNAAFLACICCVSVDAHF